jgi:uncharacterized protein YcsI (UPF0317 family)
MKPLQSEDYQQLHHRAGPALAARLACRGGALRGSTAGIAPGYVQGNLAILPQDLATDFLRFCQLNPKPCPLIGLSVPAIRACRRSARIWISAPILPATGCGAMAKSSMSRTM